MKELDFDELDRAVNSLMTDVPKGDTLPGDEQSEKTLTLDPSAASTPGSVAVASAGPVAHSGSTPTMPMSPTAPAAPSVAVRRTGRFMDVVHPSSDMKKPEPPKPPVSREGVAIASGATTNPTVGSPSPTSDLQSATSPSVSMSNSVASTTPPEWPDPLDIADPKAESPATAPLTTPFLTGAKVEKRPLGGVVSDTSPVTELNPDGIGKEGLTVDDADDQLPATPAEVQASLPEELQGDLVAIESGTAAQRVALPDTQPETQQASAGAATKVPMPLPAAPKNLDPAVPVDKPGSTSIPQQYHEEPSTGDAANGAIYDTADYHQPLAHPGKKKSGWLWVVWILLIVLLGAGAGAALYFIKLT